MMVGVRCCCADAAETLEECSSCRVKPATTTSIVEHLTLNDDNNDCSSVARSEASARWIDSSPASRPKSDYKDIVT